MIKFLKISALPLPLLAALLWPQGVAAQSGTALKSGEQVYKEACMVCHGVGVASAPRFGDKRAWAKLIGEGQAPLTAIAWVGVRGMPAKGGRDDLSLEEFARATVWMANAAGANWKDPDAQMMERIRAREARRIETLKKKSG